MLEIFRGIDLEFLSANTDPGVFVEQTAYELLFRGVINPVEKLALEAYLKTRMNEFAGLIDSVRAEEVIDVARVQSLLKGFTLGRPA